MEFKDGQLSRAKEHGKRGISAKEALDNLAKHTQELAQKEKDRREREKTKRNARIDMEALERQALSEESTNMSGKYEILTHSSFKQEIK